MDPKFCSSCSFRFTEPVNFCPDCGKAVKRSPAKKIKYGPFLSSVALLSAGLFLFGWTTGDFLAGKKPAGEFTEKSPAHSGDVKDPMVEKLRNAAKAAPQEKEGWQTLAAVLIQKIRENPRPSPDLIFETLDALRNILNIDENDANALIAMADISFDQQAFSKAVDFYKRYLELEKEDHNARSRYASALSMMNKFDDAIAELKTVTGKDPGNFHAHAYLAIAYAQKGEYTLAKETGDAALKLAPSEDARTRFSDFISKLTDGSPEPQPAKQDEGKQAENLPEDAQKIADAVKSNPVAGPKFVSAKTDGGKLLLYFKDFPMEAMPPFAKEKFFGVIKNSFASAAKQELKEVVFLDNFSGKELSRLSLE